MLKPLLSNSKNAKTVIGFLIATMVVLILMFVSAELQMRLIEDIREGIIPTDQEILANDLREQILSIIYLVCYFITGLIFITWFRRAYTNLESFGIKMKYSLSWTIWGWVIPVGFLFIPLQIILRMHKSIISLLHKYNLVEKEKGFRTRIILWWIFWISYLILGGVNMRLANSAVEFDDYVLIAQVQIVVTITGVIAAYLAIKTIRRYGEMEKLLIQIPIILGNSERTTNHPPHIDSTPKTRYYKESNQSNHQNYMPPVANSNGSVDKPTFSEEAVSPSESRRVHIEDEEANKKRRQVSKLSLGSEEQVLNDVTWDEDMLIEYLETKKKQSIQIVEPPCYVVLSDGRKSLQFFLVTSMNEKSVDKDFKVISDKSKLFEILLNQESGFSFEVGESNFSIKGIFK